MARKRLDDDTRNWCDNIRSMLYSYRIRQQEVADFVGVTREYLNKVVNAREIPSANMMEQIESAIAKIRAERV